MRICTTNRFTPVSQAPVRTRDIADRPKNFREQRLSLQHGGEGFHQRKQTAFRHIGDQVVEHAPLAEQGMSAMFGGVGFQMPVVAERLAGRPEQCQQHHREGIEQP